MKSLLLRQLALFMINFNIDLKPNMLSQEVIKIFIAIVCTA